MHLTSPPPTCSWKHDNTRTGFEVAFSSQNSHGTRIKGTTTATNGATSWITSYDICLDASWLTRSARIETITESTTIVTYLDSDGFGNWHVNGRTTPQLDGCLDLHLEDSVITTMFPIRRLHLPTGQTVTAAAAHVRAANLAVDRLERSYSRATDTAIDYQAPPHAYRLTHDQHGLPLSCPGHATRTQ